MGEEENKEFTPLQSEENILQELEDVGEKAKQERDKKVEAFNIAKAEKDKRAGVAKSIKSTGVMGGLGTGTTTPRTTTTDTDSPAKPEKPTPQNIGKDIAGLFERIDASGDENMWNQFMGGVTALMNGNHAALATAYTKQKEALINGKIKIMQGETKAALLNYRLQNGELNRVAIEAMGEGMVNKSKTSSKALDQLQEQGAGQLEMEDIPPNDRAVLAQVISTSVADTFKNIFGMVEGGTTGAATALSDDAGVVSYQQAATMLATNVAESRARKDKVAMINFELQEKWKGNVVKAMSEFENRASVEERFYQTQRMNAITMEYANAFKLMGMEQKLAEMESNLTVSIESLKTGVSRTNALNKNQMSIAKVNAQARVANQMIARDRAAMVERQKRLTGFSPMVKNAMYMDTTGMPWTSFADSNARKYMNMSDETLAGANGIRSAGTSLGSNVIAKVKGMVKDGLPQEQANIAIQNILMMGNKNFIPNNLSDEFIMAAAKAPVTPSTEFKAMLNSNPDFASGFIPSRNSSPVFMNTAIIQTFGNSASQYYKNSKKGDSSVDGLNKYLYGE